MRNVDTENQFIIYSYILYGVVPITEVAMFPTEDGIARYRHHNSAIPPLKALSLLHTILLAEGGWNLLHIKSVKR